MMTHDEISRFFSDEYDIEASACKVAEREMLARSPRSLSPKE